MKHFMGFLALSLCSTLCAIAQPKVEFEQPTQDMGTLLWQTPRTATFRLTNKSTSELRITHVEADCGCTSTDWTRTPIEPGGTGVVTATYDAELLGHFNKAVAVYTSVDEQPLYLTLMGEVSLTHKEPAVEYPFRIGDYYLSTDNIEFDDVNRGETPTYTLSLFNGSKKSYRPELMHLPKYLSVETDPQVVLPGRVGRMIITLHSDELPAMGLTQTSIYLSRFMGDRVNADTEIGVSTTLLPDFIETPSQMALAPVAHIDSTSLRIGPLDRKGRASAKITLRNDGKTPLEIKALQVYNPGLRVSLNKRRLDPGEEEKLKITLNGQDAQARGRRRILLITNDPRQPKMIIDVTVRPNKP